MVNESAPDEARPVPPLLKVEEPTIDPDKPWCDDELDRQKIADRLTTVIKDQQAQFVISLDGRWGTGKTFLLKRWKAQLVKDGLQAIYFNAWEDDFCDDPLLAIIGQLSEHFQEGKLKAMATRIGEIALPILSGRLLGVSLKREDLSRKDLLADYRTHLRTKREIRERLTDLAALVRDETDQPLVFIIDELDRCRPTFAIELLERVKHIFDVDNIVFVFGINRSELVKSLESIYGKIDAGIYLRRFFDMEFSLPDVDPEKFCQHLMDQFGLVKYFAALSHRADSNLHIEEFTYLWKVMPMVLGQMGLSLRDIDYCVRLIALTAKGLRERHTVFPSVLAVLVAVKITNPELFRQFIGGTARGAQLIDCMNEHRGRHSASQSEQDRRHLDRVEAAVYHADDPVASLEQLQLIRQGVSPSRPEFVSTATRTVDAESMKRVSNLIHAMEWFANRQDLRGIDYQVSASHLASLIDLSAGSLRE